ncbi:hypothetical protein LUZ60_006705 [Juncus effusus]|nr:hypothetical protein LUZ60_006705 [Juncus effusus]
MDNYYPFQLEDQLFHGEIMMSMSAFSPELTFDALVPNLVPVEQPVPVLRRSAFEQYVNQEMTNFVGNFGNNINKRMIGMLRKMKKDKEEKRGSPECSRGFKHMMRERQRREKLSQSYSDLYGILSSRSKGDKNSIVQSAAVYICELKGYKDQLQKKNEELKTKILDINAEGIKVKFEVQNPNSGIDSLIGALRRLKSMDVKAKTIRCDLSSRGLSTSMCIQTKMEACEVEKAIEETLKDVESLETNSRHLLPRTFNWTPNSQVENVF